MKALKVFLGGVTNTIEVSKNSGFYPQIIHFCLGFSIIFTIHFGGFTTIEGNTHMEVLLCYVLAGGFIFFNFHPENWGNSLQFDEHIFQMGWFNHQLVYIYIYIYRD